MLNGTWSVRKLPPVAGIPCDRYRVETVQHFKLYYYHLEVHWN
jgi:hypothetical protein